MKNLRGSLRKRGIALFLALTMCTSMLQITAFAAGEDDANENLPLASDAGSGDGTIATAPEEDTGSWQDSDTDGAYLFQSQLAAGKKTNTSQAMAGYLKGATEAYSVNLKVEMDFRVTANDASGSAAATTTGTTRTWQEATTIRQDMKREDKVTENHETTVTVTTTVTEEEHSVVDTELDSVVWSDSGSNTYNRPNPGPDPTPTPDPDPTPVTTVPDAPVPLAPAPVVDAPAAPADDTVTIPDTPVPLAPAEPEELVEIEDEEVPLVEIIDEEVPLANVPATGDISAMWYVLTVLSAAGLLWLAVQDAKKRRENLTK